MTMARAQLVDVSLARWYHCVTRCVRRAFLLGEGDQNRKEWLESRLEELADIFAVAVGGFSVLDNHLHVLLRLDPDVAEAWSDEKVVRRWGRRFPTREGMVRGFSLRSYVQLVDYTGGLFRQGKASIPAELAGAFERFGCSAQQWQNRMEKLRDGQLLGRFFATTRAKQREIAERLGMRRPVNLAGWPAR